MADAEELARTAHAISLEVTGGFVWEALPPETRAKWIDAAAAHLRGETGG